MKKPTKEQLYEFEAKTRRHIADVQGLMLAAISSLMRRAYRHDASKFSPEERDLYAVVVPEIEKHKYGTPEYKTACQGLGPAWEHHKNNNTHHLEGNEHGIEDMTLLSALEMLCDWMAAAEREGKHVFDNWDHTIERCGINPQLAEVLRNTVVGLELTQEERGYERPGP